MQNMCAGIKLPVLVLPGYLNSEQGHWQSIWERECNWTRVLQQNWTAPVLADWLGALTSAIRAAPGPPLLICHSLGCILAAHYVASHPHARARLSGCFMVSPPDVDPFPVLPNGMTNTFQPVPLEPFGVPSVVIVSTNDPYVTIDRAKVFADKWGSKLVNVGEKGHINVAAGVGGWQEGRLLLQDFAATISTGTPPHGRLHDAWWALIGMAIFWICYVSIVITAIFWYQFCNHRHRSTLFNRYYTSVPPLPRSKC